MRLTDLLALPVAAMWQQKSRTFLTTLGVVFGSFVLAASLSIGQGVQDTIERESHRSDHLRKITVQPKWQGEPSAIPEEEVEVSGEMTDEKRQRIRKALIAHKQRFGEMNPGARLTQEKLKELAALDHVETVVPVVWQRGFAVFGEQSIMAGVAPARPTDEACRKRLVAGTFFESPTERTAVVSEFLAYRMGRHDDAAVNSLIGKKLRLEFHSQRASGGLQLYIANPSGGEMSREASTALEKVKALLPAAIELLDLTEAEKEVLRKAAKIETSESAEPRAESYGEEFTIVGVLRNMNEEEQKGPWDPLRVDADVLLPTQTAVDLYFRVPGNSERGIDQAIVIVDREEHAKDTVASVAKLGFNSHALIDFIERERLMYLLIFGGMTCVATVALLVASLGIANTMLMSVLERTREIGIMKAVGAGNGQLQFIFLVEGALIGLFGGVAGLLLARGAAIPGDAWVRSMVFRDMKIELKEALFVFPTWLSLIVVAFAVLVTTLAAVYPARRAASVDPVSALRHE